MSRVRGTAGLGVLLWLMSASPAFAHERSVSHARVTIDGNEARVELRISALDRNALGIAEAALAPHLTSAVSLSTERSRCAPEPASFRALTARRGFFRYEWRVRCDAAPRTLRAVPIPSRPSHVCFARVTADGRTRDVVLSELAPQASLDSAGGEQGGPAFVRFVPIGIAHILSGLDHLVFLALLLLVARSPREAAAMVTGFTLGHSATLAAAALGVLRADARMVEAMIGLSIAVVAVENVWRSRGSRDRLLPIVTAAAIAALALFARSVAIAGFALFVACYFGLASRAPDDARRRCAVTAVLGLVHGLGFAGALAETGLPEEGTVLALVGFNAGVELGQLAVAALAWPILISLRGRPRANALLLELGSAAGLAAGTFWALTRL